MKKQILFILLIVLVAVILVFFFIFYAKNFAELFGGIKSSTNQENVASRADVSEVMVQLKDAEKELNNLRELAQDQESLSKIDQLFGKINFYKTKLKKSPKEIDKEIVEEFYNSGFWESIASLKAKIEGKPQNINYVPELE